MAVSFRAINTFVNSAGATSLSPVVPAATQVGDLLILCIGINTAVAQTFTGLGGWTTQKNLNVNAPVLAVFTKVAVLGDIGATLSPAWTTSAACSASVVAYAGVDSSVGAIDVSASDFNNTGSTSVKYGSMTLPLNDTVIAVGVDVTNGNAVGIPTGYTSRVNNSTNLPMAVTENPSTAGATGAITSGMVSAAASQGCLLALRPAQVPAFRQNGASASSASATTLSPAQPAATQIGDLLIAVCSSSATPTWNTPAGWTLVGSQANGSAVFYRFAAAAGGGTTHTFTISTAAGPIGVAISAYSGVGSVDATASSAVAASTSAVAPTLTSLGADRTLVIAGGWNANAGTPPVGMVEQEDVINSGRAYIADEAVPTSSTATGTRTATIASAASGVICSLMLAPPQNRPKLRASAKNATGSGTSLSVTLPASLVAGDLMVMTVAWATTISAIVAPAGWTEVESDLAGTNGEWFKAYTKTAAGGEANPTVTWTTAAGASAQVAVLVGSASLDIDGHTITAASGTVNWPSVTPPSAADLLLFFEHSDGTSAVSAMPTGSVIVLNDSTNVTAVLSYEVSGGAVATGARTGTVGAGVDNTGYVIALSGSAAQSLQMLV